MIVRSLPLALIRRLPPDDPRLRALGDEVAQDTLVRVLTRLDSFQGRSKFTTWVHAFAIHVALSELRRRLWLKPVGR
jgi:RNA polymerase sigma-70 factor (ECF subfamily)